MKKKIYLDYAAATPVADEVLKAMVPYWQKKFFNPSALYLDSRMVSQELQKFRAAAARTLACQPAEIIFTSGATESNNLALQGVINSFPKAELVVSAIEHESVLEPAKLATHRLAPVNSEGLVNLGKLAAAISDQTILVSIMMVSNELGTLQPLREIFGLVKEIRAHRRKTGNKLPIYLHSDAAQAGNYLKLDVNRLGVDMLSVNGGKLYGPKQSGLLYLRAGVQIRPLILGGGQEFGLRSGTENLAAIAGFTKALELAQANHTQENKRVNSLRNVFATELQKQLNHAVINGSAKHQAPHILSVSLLGADNERLAMELDEAGIAVGVGSACSGIKGTPSHVLAAIGLKPEIARSTLRFSFGKSTTGSDLSYTLDKLRVLTEV